MSIAFTVSVPNQEIAGTPDIRYEFNIFLPGSSTFNYKNVRAVFFNFDPESSPILIISGPLGIISTITKALTSQWNSVIGTVSNIPEQRFIAKVTMAQHSFPLSSITFVGDTVAGVWSVAITPNFSSTPVVGISGNRFIVFVYPGGIVQPTAVYAAISTPFKLPRITLSIIGPNRFGASGVVSEGNIASFTHSTFPTEPTVLRVECADNNTNFINIIGLVMVFPESINKFAVLTLSDTGMRDDITNIGYTFPLCTSNTVSVVYSTDVVSVLSMRDAFKRTIGELPTRVGIDILDTIIKDSNPEILVVGTPPLDRPDSVLDRAALTLTYQ